MSSHGHPFLCICALVSSIGNDTAILNSGPAIMPGFNLVTFLKTSLRLEVLEVQHRNCGGLGTVQPTAFIVNDFSIQKGINNRLMNTMSSPRPPVLEINDCQLSPRPLEVPPQCMYQCLDRI